MKAMTMVYGSVCYLLSVAALVLFILFANNHLGIVGLGALNIDAVRSGGDGAAMPVNMALLALFAVQHSVMARPGFKAQLTRLIPASWERSTYVLATALVLFALVWWWRPMPDLLWSVQSETGRLAITIGYYSGWLVTFLATFMLNHFHLFGLQQSFHSADPDAGTKEFKTPLFYRIVRHPIQSGVIIAMVCTPDMSAGRALLALGMLVYIAIGLYFEERDLIAQFGQTYADYKARVPAVVPFFKRGD